MFPVADVIPSRTRPYVTIGLISLNVLVFTFQLLFGDLLPRVVFALGLVPAFFSWPDLVSSTFFHAGWLHLVGNMLYLWIFGGTIEDRVGHGRYLALYVFCGTAAALGHVSFDPFSTTPAIGAGGGVSGVLGAYFVLYPQSRVLTAVFLIVVFDVVEVPAIFFLGIWTLLQLFSGDGPLGVHAEGVALPAHAVAFVAGAAAGWLWRRRIPYF